MLNEASLLGLSFGTLLITAGAALWDGFRQTAGLSRAVRVTGWAAGALLLAALLPLWAAGHGRYSLALHLTLMATIAAPPIRGHRHSPWRNAAVTLPPLVLAGVGLVLVVGRIQVAHPIPTLAGLVVMACDGLVVRALGEALGGLASPDAPPGRLFDALYLLLTLLVGMNALVTLGQRGVAWEGTGGEAGLAGTWLVWSAAWVSPRRFPRLRAGLAAAAALLLTTLTLGVH